MGDQQILKSPRRHISANTVVAFGYLLDLEKVAKFIFGSPLDLGNYLATMIELKARLNKVGYGAYFNPSTPIKETKIFVTIKGKEIAHDARKGSSYTAIDSAIKLTDFDKEKLLKFARKCDLNENLRFLTFSYEGF